MYRISFENALNANMFGRVKQIKGWEHNGRKLKDDLLVIVISGYANFNFNGKTYHIEGRDMLYIPSNTQYTAETTGYIDYYFFHFTGCSIIEVDNNAIVLLKEQPFSLLKFKSAFTLPQTTYDTLYIDNKVSFGDSFDKVLYYISKCQECSIGINSFKKRALDLWLSQLINYIGSFIYNNVNDTVDYPPMLVKILIYIQKNYTLKITLASLSGIFGVSKSYIARLFRENMSMTATKYINNLKLYHATELLRSSELNISEISEHLGFSSVYYFSKLFKSTYLVNPTKFIRQD